MERKILILQKNLRYNLRINKKYLGISILYKLYSGRNLQIYNIYPSSNLRIYKIYLGRNLSTLLELEVRTFLSHLKIVYLNREAHYQEYYQRGKTQTNI